MAFIFVNGRYQDSISSPGSLADYFTAGEDGFTLHLPKNFQSDEPIYFVHINKNEGSMRISRQVILEENAQATILESYQGRQNIAYQNEIESKIDLHANARLHFYKLQQEGDQASHKATFSSRQAANSYLGTYHVARGGENSVDHFHYALIGEGATCESVGFYTTKLKQQHDIKSHIQHERSNTNSRQLYKGMADDQSHVKFNGMVMVDPNVKEICAHQRNNNLLLSSQAEVDTKPELEIYSEDVRCSHGATVGQLDEESLFFLRSRGIDEVAARVLLTAGFANEIYDAFPNTEIEAIMRGGK